MHAELTPVFERDIDTLKNEFFHPGFSRRNLGHSKWLGPAFATRGFANPVEFDSFRSWLRGPSFGTQQSSTTNPGQEPVAWRVCFEVGRSTTTLWALGNEEIRKGLEEVHALAVEKTFDWLRNIMAGTTRRALFPAFQSGTGEHQIPYLHTEAFMKHADLQSIPTYAKQLKGNAEFLRSRLDVEYVMRFGPWREMKAGAIDQSSETDVQRCLFKGFKTENDRGKFYEGEKLFVAWREEAKTRGWGPERVDTVLHNAAKLYQDKLQSPLDNSSAPTKARMTFSDWVQKLRPGKNEIGKIKDKGPTHSF